LKKLKIKGKTFYQDEIEKDKQEKILKMQYPGLFADESNQDKLGRIVDNEIKWAKQQKLKGDKDKKSASDSDSLEELVLHDNFLHINHFSNES